MSAPTARRGPGQAPPPRPLSPVPVPALARSAHSSLWPSGSFQTPRGQASRPLGHPSCTPGRPCGLSGFHSARPSLSTPNLGCECPESWVCVRPRVLRVCVFLFGGSCERSALDLGGSVGVFVLFCLLPWGLSERMSERRGLRWSGPVSLFLQPMDTGCPWSRAGPGGRADGSRPPDSLNLRARDGRSGHVAGAAEVEPRHGLLSVS